MSEYAFGKRYDALQQDADFQEYADLWREFELARGNFMQRNIPQVVGVDNNGAPVERVVWIMRAERDIPVQLMHLKAKYNAGPGGGLNIAKGDDVATTLAKHGDSLMYRDLVTLQEMQQKQINLPVLEARYKREWASLQQLIKRLAASRYARRMDPAISGVGKTPRSNGNWYVGYETLDLEPGTFSRSNQQRELGLQSMLL